ncbi:hypothetical protein MNBD_NITROSPINAE04-2113 [hydrothermal vent metagenome]|uniref:Uncharacterized protein n=1 Tax=hydrothermal vent metagenome TaxID=652676 RepID=A0A3B1CHG9_9ZZZZ
MPSSLPTDIRFPISCAYELQPKSVLDIGIGFGRWGFLFREFLDVFMGRIYKDTWAVKIDGVEAYEPYIMDHHRAIYDNIFIEDARTYIQRAPHYDLIVIGDMLEHLNMDEAITFFHDVMNKTNGGLLINIPLGKCEQDGHENPYETHRSTWEKENLMELNPTLFQISSYGKNDDGKSGQHGVFFFKKNDYQYFQAIEEGQQYESRGQIDNSAACYERAKNTAPNKPDAYLSLAGIALNKGDINLGLQLLRHVIEVSPDTSDAYLALVSLLKKLDRKEEAAAIIDAGLFRFAGNQEIIEQLESF